MLPPRIITAPILACRKLGVAIVFVGKMTMVFFSLRPLSPKV